MRFFVTLALFCVAAITFANGNYADYPPNSMFLGSGKLHNSCGSDKEDFRVAMNWSCQDGGCWLYYGLKLAKRVKHYKFFVYSWGTDETYTDGSGNVTSISVRTNKDVKSIEGEPLPPYDDGWVDGVPAGTYLKNVEIKRKEADGGQLTFVFTYQSTSRSDINGIYITSMQHQQADGCVEKWQAAAQSQAVTKEWVKQNMRLPSQYGTLWQWQE